MSRAVNLLPDSCHNARRRALRRNAWTAAGLSAGLLLLGTWVALHATERAIDRLERELGSLHGKQSELDHHLTLATIARTDLVDQARALAALRQRHPLPGQLLTLARQAPSGIVLTEVLAQPTLPTRSPARLSSRMSRAAAAEPRRTSANDETLLLVVQMSGYAVDHDELARLIEAVQRVPEWEQVELLRATREPYRSGVAIAFQLQCQAREATP